MVKGFFRHGVSCIGLDIVRVALTGLQHCIISIHGDTVHCPSTNKIIEVILMIKDPFHIPDVLLQSQHACSGGKCLSQRTQNFAEHDDLQRPEKESARIPCRLCHNLLSLHYNSIKASSCALPTTGCCSACCGACGKASC